VKKVIELYDFRNLRVSYIFMQKFKDMRKKLGYLASLALSTILFVGCLPDEEVIDYAAQDEEAIKNYIAQNNIEGTVRDASGLYYLIDEEGEGDSPTMEAALDVNYKSSLLNGKAIGQSKEYPASFYLGYEIPGLRIGLQKIGKGGKIHLYIPSDLAYGSASSSLIPAHSVIVYDIELLDFNTDKYAKRDSVLIQNYLKENELEAEMDAEGLFYHVTEEGNGLAINAYSSVKVSYKGELLDGSVFAKVEEKDATTISLSTTIKGWKMGLPYVKQGGRIKLYIPSRYAYGMQGRFKTDANGYEDRDSLLIPQNSVLIFDVFVHE